MNAASIEERWRIFVNEAVLKRNFLVAIFVCASLLFTLVGLAWPRTYQSYATILVENQNIIGPLMEGAAVPTETRDRGRTAQELIFSRAVMRDILEVGGWLGESEGQNSAALNRLADAVGNTITFVGKLNTYGSSSGEQNDPSPTGMSTEGQLAVSTETEPSSAGGGSTDVAGAAVNTVEDAAQTPSAHGVLSEVWEELSVVFTSTLDYFGYGSSSTDNDDTAPSAPGDSTADAPAQSVRTTYQAPDLAEQELLIEAIKRRTTVSTAGKSLVRIAYKDNDPLRAQRVTNRYAETFVAKSVELKLGESESAFDFIDTQVKAYRKKLVEAETKLKEWRSENIDARLGTDSEISEKISSLRNAIEKTELELKEAEIREESLQSQLTGEASAGTPLTKADQYRVRMAQLQAELDILRLSYRDTYPDIVQLRYQIEDLRRNADREETRRLVAREEAAERGEIYVDESIAFNPLYHDLRRQLAQARTTIAILKARIHEKELALSGEIVRGKRVHTSEAVQADLIRDYEVNRDIYDDLLRRRETARVSKHLDSDQEGPQVRIYESAFIPPKPIGLRFAHFLSGGLLLGIVLPVGLLLLIQQIDPRIRSADRIARELALPVVAVVPHMYTPRERAWSRMNNVFLVGVVALNLLAIGAMAMVRLQGIA